MLLTQHHGHQPTPLHEDKDEDDDVCRAKDELKRGERTGNQPTTLSAKDLRIISPLLNQRAHNRPCFPKALRNIIIMKRLRKLDGRPRHRSRLNVGTDATAYILSMKWSRGKGSAVRPLRVRVVVTMIPTLHVGSRGSPGMSCQWSNTHWGNACPPVLARRSAVKPKDSFTGR